MARYQIPPNPDEKPPKRQRNRQPLPWGWLSGGLIIALVAMVLALMLVRNFLFRPPLEVSQPDPTLIILTAPPSPIPSATPDIPTATAVPTFTPIPTPDIFIAPAEITTGYFAQVVGTEGAGVRVRGGPSVNNVNLAIANEEAYVLVLDGPAEGDGFIWWQVQLPDGTEGWTVAQYLTPVAAPPGTELP